MEAFCEENEVFVPFLEEVSGSGHLGPAGILADAGKIDFFFLHVVAHPDVVKVRRDVDQRVGHGRVSVLRQHLLNKELEAAGRVRKSGNTTTLKFVGINKHRNIQNSVFMEKKRPVFL